MKTRRQVLRALGALAIISTVLAGPQAAAAAEEKKPSQTTVSTYHLVDA